MTDQPQILLVDDDADIRELACDYLQEHGLNAASAANAEQMWRAIRQRKPDLIVLDIMMPGQDGISVCREVNGAIPIILLTAMAEEADRVLGLETGADDYVTKPFSPRELLARIRSVLRRENRSASSSSHAATTCLTFDKWILDHRRRLVTAPDGRVVVLTGAEFDLLWTLASQSGVVLDRDTLLATTRGRGAAPFDRAIDVLISRLRSKLGDRDLIKTVRGGGYQFTAFVEADPR